MIVDRARCSVGHADAGADFEPAVSGEHVTSPQACDTGVPQVEVDGVWRPAINANGKAIHPTHAGVVNFWQWFKDSQMIDDQGRPLVVYHGTGRGIAFFDPSKSKSLGVFFAADPASASLYAEMQAQGLEGARVLPVYVAVGCPLIVAGREYSHAALHRARSGGRDGLVTLDDAGHPSLAVAFESSQIKSALGNRGTFSPRSPFITA